MSTNIGTAVLELRGETAQFRAEMEGAAQRLKSVGQRMASVGSTLSLTVTAPIVAAGIAITRTAASFEAEMSKITGLVGVAADQVDAWGQDILDLAPQLGRAPQELAEGLFFVTSAGFRGAEAMDVLTVSAKAASAGLGDTATIANAVTSAVNAYGIENLSAARATDILTAAVREGKLEAASMAPVLGNLLPTASALGIGFEQIAGTLAVFSRTGADAASGATSLNAIMTTLLKPSKQARDALDDVGLSMAKMKEVATGPNGLVNVMRLLDETFGSNNDALAAIFPNQRAFRGVMNALAQDAATVDGVLQGVADSTGALDHAFEAASETARFKMNAAMASISALLIGLGSTVLPVVAAGFGHIASVLGAMGRAFGILPQWIKTAAVAFLGLVAAIGPVLLLVGKLVTLAPLLVTALAALKITALISGFAGWASAMWAAVSAAQGLSASLVALQVAIGPAGWLVLGIGAVVGALALWRKATKDQTAAQRELNGVLAESERAFRASPEGRVAELRAAEKRYDDLAASVKRLQRAAIAAGDTNLGRNLSRQAIRAQRDLIALGTTVEGLRSEVEDLQRMPPIDLMSGDAGAGFATASEAVKEAVDNLRAALREAAGMNELLGDSFDLTSARAGAYRSAIEELVAAGVSLDARVGPQGETLRQLAATFLDLEKNITAATDAQAEARRMASDMEAVTRSLLTPLEQYEATVARLDAMLALNAEFQQTYNRALAEAKRRYDEATPAGRQMAEMLEAKKRLLADIQTPQEAYIQQVALLELMYSRGLITLEELMAGIERLRAVLARATGEMSGPLEKLAAQMRHVALQGADAFADFALGSKNAIKNFVEDAMRQLARLLARLLLIRTLTAAIPGAGAFFGVAPIGARASGGPVMGNRPYLVGEKGPELFIPRSAGTVVPNYAMAAAGNTPPIDFSTFPPATNPLAAARDDQWQLFLRESLQNASADGHDPWRRG